MRRKKGIGSLRKVGNAYYYRIKIDGKEKAIRLKAINEKDAEKEAATYAAPMSVTSDADVALFVARQKKIDERQNALELSAVFDRFKESPTRPQCTEKYLRRHETYWREFTAANYRLENTRDITSAICEDYFSKLNRPARSWNARLKSIRLILKTVLPYGTENPTAQIRLKVEDPQSKKEFTEDQIKKVFGAVDADYPLSIPYRDEMKILFRLGAYTGMRLKDCCLIQWKAISNDTIKVKPHKTEKFNRYVTIPLHPELKNMLPPPGADDDYVLPGLAGRYMRNSSGVAQTSSRIMHYVFEKQHKIYKELFSQKKKAMLPDIQKDYGFHSFRHSFVSFCANAGVPVDIVKDIVGHSNTAITRIYTHISAETRAKVINALPSMNAEKPIDKKQKLKELLLSKKKLTEAERMMLEMLD